MKRDSWWLRNGRKRLVLLWQLSQHGNPGNSMLWEYIIKTYIIKTSPMPHMLMELAKNCRQCLRNFCVCCVSMGLLQVRGIQDSLRAMFNPHFGSTFRSHNNPTYFSRKLFRLLTQFNILPESQKKRKKLSTQVFWHLYKPCDESSSIQSQPLLLPKVPDLSLYVAIIFPSQEGGASTWVQDLVCLSEATAAWPEIWIEHYLNFNLLILQHQHLISSHFCNFWQTLVVHLSGES